MPFTVKELGAAIRTANEHFRGVMQTEEQLLKDRLMFGISLYRFDEAGAKVRIDPRGIDLGRALRLSGPGTALLATAYSNASPSETMSRRLSVRFVTAICTRGECMFSI